MLQSKRLTTCAMVRDEVMDVVQARAVSGSSPMLVDAFLRAKVRARARKRKVRARTRRVRMRKARVTVGRTEPRTAVTRVKTPRTVLRGNVFTATVLDT